MLVCKENLRHVYIICRPTVFDKKHNVSHICEIQYSNCAVSSSKNTLNNICGISSDKRPII